MPKTKNNQIYEALLCGNTRRLKALLIKSGLSDVEFLSIKKSRIKDLSETIMAASRLKEPKDNSVVPRKSDFDKFFDYIVSAVNKGCFLEQIRDTADVKKASENQKLPKDIQTILYKPELVNRLPGLIEGLSNKQLASLIMYISPSEGISPADINYELFRTIIKAIRNTELIPRGQLCRIMADNLSTR